MPTGGRASPGGSGPYGPPPSFWSPSKWPAPSGRSPCGYPLFSFQYLQSIAGHALLVLIPLLWLVGDGFRPDARYLPRLFGMLLVIAGADAVVNVVLGSNYLFISRAPADTPIELFDAWVGHPGYVGILALVVFLVWIAMYLPWTLASRRSANGWRRRGLDGGHEPRVARFRLHCQRQRFGRRGARADPPPEAPDLLGWKGTQLNGKDRPASR